MSTPEAFDAFATRLADWTSAPIIHENDDFYPPDDPSPFVFVEIFSDNHVQDTMGAPGANMWVERGSTFLHVMVRSGTGTGQARTLAKSLVQLFREQPIGELYFDEMSIGAGEPGRSFANYFAMTVSIQWERRDITDLT